MSARVLWLALLLAAPASVQAQAADLGLARDLADPVADPDAAPEADAPRAEDDAEEEGPWSGPQIQMGYAYSKLADGYGGGDTHAASFEVFVHWPLPQLRTSVFAELGGRDFNLGGDDFYARAALSVGFQLPELIDPLVPHVALVVTTGAVVGERFDSTVAYGFGGGGIELGAAVRIVRNLHVAASFTYLRLEMDGAAFDVFEVRVGFGL